VEVRRLLTLIADPTRESEPWLTAIVDERRYGSLVHAGTGYFAI
jgi:hypothetical protein